MQTLPKWLFKDAGDWRTLLLVVACQAMCIALLFFDILPIWLTVICLAPILTLYSSLQHEIIHGHPFKAQWMCDLLVIIPFGLLVPYFRFKDTHLAHHHDVNLCDPYEDPETWYQAKEMWEKRSSISQAVFNFNNLLAGRMLLGPLIGMTGFIKCDFKAIIAGNLHILIKWAFHILGVAALLVLISAYGKMPIWAYFLAAYFAMSLLMVRTFLEHQAHEKVRGRSVIIENGGILAFMFLNNSYHAVHHAYPGYAWYRLPSLFFENRERFLKINKGYAYPTYRAIFKAYFFKRKEPVPFPDEPRR